MRLSVKASESGPTPACRSFHHRKGHGDTPCGRAQGPRCPWGAPGAKASWRAERRPCPAVRLPFWKCPAVLHLQVQPRPLTAVLTEPLKRVSIVGGALALFYFSGRAGGRDPPLNRRPGLTSLRAVGLDVVGRGGGEPVGGGAQPLLLPGPAHAAFLGSAAPQLSMWRALSSSLYSPPLSGESTVLSVGRPVCRHRNSRVCAVCT